MPQSTKNGLHAELNAPSLVVTLGPSSAGKEEELADLGVAQFRINASHMSVEGLRNRMQVARQAAPKVPIIVDLQGAKMRLGNFEPRDVAEGDLVRFSSSAELTDESIPLPHSEVYAVLVAGDPISIDDGRLTGTVERVRGETIEVLMQSRGRLLSRKGFNRDVHPVVLQSLCARDVDMIRAAYGCGCRDFAVSFVFDGKECDWVRSLASDARLVAKIERRDALNNLDAIIRSADALWICRGDLGVQLGIANLGRAVGRLDPRKMGKPVYMAGQLLEHMTLHRDATRSEVCHIYDLVQRGYAGIVLSDETAIGCDPVHVTRVARSLLDDSVTS